MASGITQLRGIAHLFSNFLYSGFTKYRGLAAADSIPTPPPPPSGDLIEGFESFSAGLPNTLIWEKYEEETSVSVSQTTDHVTQGTYSCRIQGLLGIDAGIFTSADVSGSTTLEVDVYVASVPDAGAYAYLYSIETIETIDQTPAGATGAYTLSLSVVDLTNITIALGISSPLAITGADVFFDNLRLYSD